MHPTLVIFNLYERHGEHCSLPIAGSLGDTAPLMQGLRVPNPVHITYSQNQI